MAAVCHEMECYLLPYISSHRRFPSWILQYAPPNTHPCPAAGVGASVGARPPPLPPPENLYGGLFATFSSYGFSIFVMWGNFCYFFLHLGGSFFGLAPPPTKISVGTHACASWYPLCKLLPSLHHRHLSCIQ